MTGITIFKEKNANQVNRIKGQCVLFLLSFKELLTSSMLLYPWSSHHSSYWPWPCLALSELVMCSVLSVSRFCRLFRPAHPAYTKGLDEMKAHAHLGENHVHNWHAKQVHTLTAGTGGVEVANQNLWPGTLIWRDAVSYETISPDIVARFRPVMVCTSMAIFRDYWFCVYWKHIAALPVTSRSGGQNYIVP